MKFLELLGQFQISKTCLLYFRYSVIISPCERAWPPSFEQYWIPFTQECFVPIGWNWPRVCGEEDEGLKLAQWIRRRRFSNFLSISPWKKAWPFIWTELVILVLPMDVLCQVWLKLAWWFRRIRWTCENLRTDRWRTNGQQAIWKLTWAFSSGELRS